MRKLLFTLLAAAAVASCTKDDVYDVSEGDVYASFTSASIDTRVTDDGEEWVYGDQIGITMVNLSTTETENDTETIADNSDNIPYQTVTEDDYTIDGSDYTDATSEKVAFTPVVDDDALLYPNIGSVKFYAYYPYNSEVSGYIYSADVSDQSKVIDFMVAASGVKDRNSDPIALDFTHMLSKLTITITGNENVTDLKGVTASISGLNTTGSYDIRDDSQDGALGDKKAIDFVMSYGAANAQNNNAIETAYATAIILPEEVVDATVTFVLGDRAFSVSLTKIFAASTHYSYNVALGNDYAEFTGEGEDKSTIVPWGTPTDDNTSLYPQEIDIALVDNVYQIYTDKGLQAFAALVNGEAAPTGLVTLGNIEFISNGDGLENIDGCLMNNIDLSEVCNNNKWYQIVNNSDNRIYKGHFDGNNKTVSGLKYSIEAGAQGLFGYIVDATIEDLAVSGELTVEGSSVSEVGGVVGNAESSTITGCSFSGTITAQAAVSARIGGVVGYARLGTTITDCYFSGALTASGSTASVGGVVGYASGAYDNIIPITDCYNLGTVTAEGSTASVGGVVGYGGFSTITGCYNSGELTAKGTDAIVGGVVGYAYYGSTVTGCYNSGALTAEESGAKVGGVAGYAYYSTVTSCYSYGAVSSASSSNLGGVLGQNDAENIATISYCYYDTYTVTGTNNTPTGAVNGTNYSSTASGATANTAYNIEVYGFNSNTDTTPMSTLLTNLNTGISTYNTSKDEALKLADWKADETPNINSGYPILSWQATE